MEALLLDFYTLDLTTIVTIILVSCGVFLFLNYKDTKDENFTFNLISSLLIGIFCSIIYSYFTLEADERMTSNFWDKNVF